VIDDNFVTLLLQLPANETPDAAADFYDMSGRKVCAYRLTDYATSLSLNLASGTYLIKVLTKGGQELVSKIMIKK
jgi:hypothetical protein